LSGIVGGRRGVGLFFPTQNLGPYAMEIELVARKNEATKGTIQILKCKDKGRMVTRFVEGRALDPAWFLCNFESGI
jgi:hypothetical protein